VAEGAALEMPCTGNCTVGSNPTPSAISEVPMTWPVSGEGSAARRRAKRRARRTLCTLSEERAPTKRMGPHRQPALVGRARRGGSGAL
jgi:hypothetical protein